MIKSKENERAERAMRDIEIIKKYKFDNNKELKGYISSLPALIMNSGLGAAMAFYYSKPPYNEDKKNGEKITRKVDKGIVFICVASWLLKETKNDDYSLDAILRNEIRLRENYKELAQKFFDWYVNADAGQLLFATQEALAYLKWLKRFADVEIGGKDEK